ncbi:hypothetical protein AAVH_42154 [Aphelenchoides avenae]|nr:hypothetical protein AAVH_42154 [Aphelenchus avenae]
MIVQEVVFECTLDHVVFDAILPHMERLRNSVCRAPTMYATLDLIERAFAELFFCRVIDIKALGVDGADELFAYNKERPFVSLGCIQGCELLRIHGLKTVEFGGKLLEWLFSGGDKKKLTLEKESSALTLLLNTDHHMSKFKQATTPSIVGYVREVNEHTKEELIRQCEVYEDGGIKRLKVTLLRRPLAVD